jgi:hypothetical protein
MAYTQDERMCQVTSPLGENVLLLTALSARESLSNPFFFDMQFVSATEDIDFAAVVGAPLRLGRCAQARIRRHHLRHGHAGAEALAQAAKWAIGHPRHGRDDEIVGDVMRTDVHVRILQQGGADYTEFAPALSAQIC